MSLTAAAAIVSLDHLERENQWLAAEVTWRRAEWMDAGEVRELLTTERSENHRLRRDRVAMVGERVEHERLRSALSLFIVDADELANTWTHIASRMRDAVTDSGQSGLDRYGNVA